MEKQNKYTEKYKAFERLIFLVRVKNEGVNINFKDISKRLDNLNVPFWKQNNISYLSLNTNWYITKIISTIWNLEKPLKLKEGF